VIRPARPYPGTPPGSSPDCRECLSPRAALPLTGIGEQSYFPGSVAGSMRIGLAAAVARFG